MPFSTDEKRVKMTKPCSKRVHKDPNLERENELTKRSTMIIAKTRRIIAEVQKLNTEKERGKNRMNKLQ